MGHDSWVMTQLSNVGKVSYIFYGKGSIPFYLPSFASSDTFEIPELLNFRIIINFHPRRPQSFLLAPRCETL